MLVGERREERWVGRGGKAEVVLDDGVFVGMETITDAWHGQVRIEKRLRLCFLRERELEGAVFSFLAGLMWLCAG